MEGKGGVEVEPEDAGKGGAEVEPEDSGEGGVETIDVQLLLSANCEKW